MTNKEKLLAAQMLEDASEQYSNHGCNDLPGDTFGGWTDAEKEALCEGMRQWNSKGTDPYPEDVEQIGDDSLMSYFAHGLEEEARSPLNPAAIPALVEAAAKVSLYIGSGGNVSVPYVFAANLRDALARAAATEGK